MAAASVNTRTAAPVRGPLRHKAPRHVRRYRWAVGISRSARRPDCSLRPPRFPFLAGTQAARVRKQRRRQPAAPADDAIAEVVSRLQAHDPLQDTPVEITAPMPASDAHVRTAGRGLSRAELRATTQGDHGVITMTCAASAARRRQDRYADPEVAIFVDGIYSPRAEGGRPAAVRHERDRVSRPQGTLWGRTDGRRGQHL